MCYLCFLCFVSVIFVFSVHYSNVVTCWERPGSLALLCVMFSCVFVTFPCGVLGQVWYLIVTIRDFCLLPYFDDQTKTYLHFHESRQHQQYQEVSA